VRVVEVEAVVKMVRVGREEAMNNASAPSEAKLLSRSVIGMRSSIGRF
jgi:hypothetical protein